MFGLGKRKPSHSISVGEHLDLLGKEVVDRVTGLEGVVASVGFDLFGCVQATVTPEAQDDGKLPDSRWMDVARLRVTDHQPVMERPDWSHPVIAAGQQGAADKPKIA